MYVLQDAAAELLMKYANADTLKPKAKSNVVRA
jgi:hypothetical protein